MDIETAIRIFLAFVAGFQLEDAGPQDEREPTPVDVKREHSLQVLENARAILLGLDLSPGMERLGLLAALFHDVGRFPQYQRFKTFHDPSSLNHGLLGSRTLAPAPLGSGLLDALPFTERSLVRGAVAMHNRCSLPAGISPQLRILTEVVRDADKLDIMRVMIRHFSNENKNPVITLHVAPHPENFTQQIYEGVYNGTQGDYRAMRWTNDFKLLLVGWAHNLAFAPSRRLLKKRRLLEQLFALLPDNTAMRALQQQVFKMLEQDLLKSAPLPQEVRG